MMELTLHLTRKRFAKALFVLCGSYLALFVFNAAFLIPAVLRSGRGGPWLETLFPVYFLCYACLAAVLMGTLLGRKLRAWAPSDLHFVLGFAALGHVCLSLVLLWQQQYAPGFWASADPGVTLVTPAQISLYHWFSASYSWPVMIAAAVLLLSAFFFCWHSRCAVEQRAVGDKT